MDTPWTRLKVNVRRQSTQESEDTWFENLKIRHDVRMKITYILILFFVIVITLLFIIAYHKDAEGDTNGVIKLLRGPCLNGDEETCVIGVPIGAVLYVGLVSYMAIVVQKLTDSVQYRYTSARYFKHAFGLLFSFVMVLVFYYSIWEYKNKAKIPDATYSYDQPIDLQDAFPQHFQIMIAVYGLRKPPRGQFIESAFLVKFAHDWLDESANIQEVYTSINFTAARDPYNDETEWNGIRWYLYNLSILDGSLVNCENTKGKTCKIDVGFNVNETLIKEWDWRERPEIRMEFNNIHSETNLQTVTLTHGENMFYINPDWRRYIYINKSEPDRYVMDPGPINSVRLRSFHFEMNNNQYQKKFFLRFHPMAYDENTAHGVIIREYIGFPFMNIVNNLVTMISPMFLLFGVFFPKTLPELWWFFGDPPKMTLEAKRTPDLSFMDSLRIARSPPVHERIHAERLPSREAGALEPLPLRDVQTV